MQLRFVAPGFAFCIFIWLTIVWIQTTLLFLFWSSTMSTRQTSGSIERCVNVSMTVNEMDRWGSSKSDAHDFGFGVLWTTMWTKKVSFDYFFSWQQKCGPKKVSTHVRASNCLFVEKNVGKKSNLTLIGHFYLFANHRYLDLACYKYVHSGHASQPPSVDCWLLAPGPVRVRSISNAMVPYHLLPLSSK